ncbi:MAG TPA: hypothetical protein VMN37_05290 [Gemmatimonadales bacterium]|nr:hypothetical protein [Gemmatimonadales bacterium]
MIRNQRRSSTASHLRRGGLALVVALVGVSTATAQAGYPSGPPGAQQYRLTLAELRKVMPAVGTLGQERCEKREETRDPYSLTLAEMTASLERCEPIRAALAKAGVSSKEAAAVLGAFMYASRRITEEESARAMGKQAPALPAGPLKDNVALIRQHEAELRRLTQSPTPGAGS